MAPTGVGTRAMMGQWRSWPSRRGETRPSQWWLSPAAAPAEWAPTSRCCELRAARSRGVQRHSPRAPGRLWCARRRCRRSPISTIAASRSWATNRRTAVRRLRPRTAWPGLSLHRRGRRRARSSPCWPVTWRCSAARRSLRCERICRPAPVSRGWSPPRGPVRTGSARCGGSIRSCRSLRRPSAHRCDRGSRVSRGMRWTRSWAMSTPLTMHIDWGCGPASRSGCCA